MVSPAKTLPSLGRQTDRQTGDPDAGEQRSHLQAGLRRGHDDPQEDDRVADQGRRDLAQGGIGSGPPEHPLEDPHRHPGGHEEEKHDQRHLDQAAL